MTGELVHFHRKILVLGEYGSGKSELAVNLALGLRRDGLAPVRFFDMDQTKPLFRARELAALFAEADIAFRDEKQFMDAPTVPAGVKESLAEPSLWTVMDLGGGGHGSICVGQFASEIRAADSIALYTINPFRAFSETPKQIRETMEEVRRCSGLHRLRIVCSPYVGVGTTAADVLWGVERLRELLQPLGEEIFLCAVPEPVWDAVHRRTGVPEIKIRSALRRLVT